METNSKMKTLLFCVASLTCVFELIWEYQFSFMKLPVFLVICVFFVGFIFFPDSWFCCIWGLLTGLAIYIPMMKALFHHSQNYIAILFDGLLSLSFIMYYGFKIYKKYKMIQEMKS